MCTALEAGGTWYGGREKAPAALVRMAIACDDQIEIWGDGTQSRTFLFIDDSVDALIRVAEVQD